MAMKFFIEYEFKTKAGSRYWVPVFITADTETEARKIEESLRIGLEAKFEVKKPRDLRPVIEGVNSDFLDNYAKEGLKGRIAMLSVNYVKFLELEPEPGWSFESHMRIIEATPEDYADKPFGISTGIDLPATCVETMWPDFERLLVVDVVKPTIT
ncbi:MAG: hypothetical protein ACOC34_07550 [Thermotogota bacterium]